MNKWDVLKSELQRRNREQYDYVLRWEDSLELMDDVENGLYGSIDAAKHILDADNKGDLDLAIQPLYDANQDNSELVDDLLTALKTSFENNLIAQSTVGPTAVTDFQQTSPIIIPDNIDTDNLVMLTEKVLNEELNNTINNDFKPLNVTDMF